MQWTLVLSRIGWHQFQSSMILSFLVVKSTTVFFSSHSISPLNLLFYVIAFKLFSHVCQILQSFSFKVLVFFWVSNSVLTLNPNNGAK